MGDDGWGRGDLRGDGLVSVTQAVIVGGLALVGLGITLLVV